METRKEFRDKIRAKLLEIGEDALSFDESEFWLIRGPYEYVEFYAAERRLINTSIALPLSRGLHDGAHRKSTVIKGGTAYRIPYLIHPLLVCRMLIDLHIPVSREDEDLLLAGALCHDMIEDLDFEDGGRELIDRFGLDPRIYDIVRRLSKRYDFTDEEEKDFFHQIEADPLTALIKLSDRGNNVEDLYNMSVRKVHEYVGETKKFFLPMCGYARENYPDLRQSFEILEDKILCLTVAAETLVDRYEAREQELTKRLEELRRENETLRAEWNRRWFS